MFEEAYPSADNQVSGIVAMLAAAEAIGKVKETVQQADKDIMFTFFQGVGFLPNIIEPAHGKTNKMTCAPS